MLVQLEMRIGNVAHALKMIKSLAKARRNMRNQRHEVYNANDSFEYRKIIESTQSKSGKIGQSEKDCPLSTLLTRFEWEEFI